MDEVKKLMKIVYKFKRTFDFIKRFKLIIILGIVGTLIFILSLNHYVTSKSKAFIYSDPDSIKFNKTGLLLGTSKFLSSGSINRFYKNRIDATLLLYQKGKIEFLVISGDNSRQDYSEPDDMKNDLIQLGFPKEKIFLDYAGFRTLDSIIRMDKIFGQKSFTIISQKFHNERAIFIAQKHHLNVVGFNAKEVDAYNSFLTKFREKFARVKLFLDLLINKKPQYLGDPIHICHLSE